MMIEIKSLQQFEEEIEECDSYCIFFGRDKSPTCRVMQRVLIEICKKRDYKLLYLDVSIKKFYKLTIKYDVGVIPHYVFVNNDEIMCEGVGTLSKRNLYSRLKGLEG